jgi:hypothetical protein
VRTLTALASLGIGIASSLFATLAFLCLAQVVKTIIVPWFEDKIYRGVRLDGRWSVAVTSQENPGSAQNPSLSLQQKGDRISGFYSHDVSGTLQIYRVEGQIRNTYFTASLWPVSNKEVDTAAILLRVFTRDGLKMSGILTIVDTGEGKVTAHEILLTHIGS